MRHGADVDVQSLVERADLALAADLGVLGAAAHRPVQAADAVARFEDAEVVAELAELVADGQPGHAGAEDQHLRAARPAGQRRTHARLAGHQVPRRHRGHDERRAADRAELSEEAAPGPRRMRMHAGHVAKTVALVGDYRGMSRTRGRMPPAALVGVCILASACAARQARAVEDFGIPRCRNGADQDLLSSDALQCWFTAAHGRWRTLNHQSHLEALVVEVEASDVRDAAAIAQRVVDGAATRGFSEILGVCRAAAGRRVADPSRAVDARQRL